LTQYNNSIYFAWLSRKQYFIINNINI